MKKDTCPDSVRHLAAHVLTRTEDQQSTVIAITTTGSPRSSVAMTCSLAPLLGRYYREAPTIVIDADWHRPHTDWEQKQNDTPVTLAGLLESEPGQLTCTTLRVATGFEVLPAGHPSLHPSELVCRAAFGRLIAHLRSRYRFVVILTPPVLASVETCLIARHADLVLITAERGRCRVQDLVNARERLAAVQAVSVEVVLTSSSPSRSSIPPCVSSELCAPAVRHSPTVALEVTK